MPGSHATLASEPNVAAWAHLLRGCVDGVAGGGAKEKQLVPGGRCCVAGAWFVSVLLAIQGAPAQADPDNPRVPTLTEMEQGQTEAFAALADFAGPLVTETAGHCLVLKGVGDPPVSVVSELTRRG